MKLAASHYDLYNKDAPTKIKLPEVIQPTSLHPSKDVELWGTEASVGDWSVGLPRRGTTALRLRYVPASGPWHWLQLQLIEVSQVPLFLLGKLSKPHIT